MTLGIPEIAALVTLISARVAFTDKFTFQHSKTVELFAEALGDHPIMLLGGKVLHFGHALCVSIILASIPAGMVWLLVKFLVKFI